MSDPLEIFLSENPEMWIDALPGYQQNSIRQLRKVGVTYEEIANRWMTASASNNFQFGTTLQGGPKDGFLANVRIEVRAFLCGDKRYATQRAGLFGKNAPARTFVISSISVSISPHIGVASAVLSPVVAIILASLGSIALNAWCAATEGKS